MANVGGREVNNNDLGVMAAGGAALIFSFLPYWGYSVKSKGFGSAGGSISAWHSYAWLGMLLLVVAAGIVAARVFGGVTLPATPVGWHVIVAACAVLGTLLVILRALTIDNANYSGFGSSISSGVKWGGYLLFIAAIVESVFAVMALRESGESVSFDRGTPDAPPPAAT
ncbi:MAG: hypothetical protein QOF84_6831 [Streptomyces sp.]|nr:hypothetical protein [Streptomyces sp.]